MNGTGAVADDARKKIEPMDAEVPEDEIVHGFERCPRNPAVVPADLDVNASDFADEAGIDRLADIGEMRRPAAVLIDRELEAAPLRELNEFPPVIEVLDERFLRQHVLIGLQRAPHEIEADVRMGCEVEDADVRIAQHRIEIVRNARIWEMGGAARPGALEIA